MQSHARFLIIFAVVGLALPLLALWLVEPLEGELTRIGHLPERAFGWNAAQPPRVGKASTVDRLDDAEILIAGDSFSISGVWQSYAFAPERKYMTKRLGRICRDFPAFTANLGKIPNTLIIEIVERSARVVLTVGCAKSVFVPLAGQEVVPGERDRGFLGGVFGYKYVIGSGLYYLIPGTTHRAGSSGGVNLVRVDSGCEYFSNRECDLGLFLGDDFTLQPMAGDDIASRKLAMLQGLFKQVLVVVVPNKSSVYLDTPEEAMRKDDELRQFGRNLGVEVLPLQVAFQGARSRIKDLYQPNGTHLSTLGYRELAVQIAKTSAVAVRP